MRIYKQSKKQEVNTNLRKSERTKYLPHVNALGGYLWMSMVIVVVKIICLTT